MTAVPRSFDPLRLNQQQAATLIGVGARALRDHPAPRNPDGTYSGPELVQWAATRLKAATLDDETEEKLLVACEALSDALGDVQSVGAVYELLTSVGRRFGDGGFIAFGVTLGNALRSWLALCHPTTDEDRRCKVEEDRRIEFDRNARALLRISVVCEKCERLRRGSKWVRSTPPADHAVVLGICVTCTAKHATVAGNGRG